MNRAQPPRAGVPNNNHVSAPAPAAAHMPASSGAKKTPIEKPAGSRWFRITNIALLFSVGILIAALAAYIGFGNSNQETKYINKDEYQAVFTNNPGENGGLYFGHIQTLTNNFIRLTNVFYIQPQINPTTPTSSSKTSSNASMLVKLGCEIHGPEDAMIITRSEVLYWENIKTNGQVAEKIAEYYKNNPNTTQSCSSTSSNTTDSATSQSSSTESSNTTTSNNTNIPATNNSTKR